MSKRIDEFMSACLITVTTNFEFSSQCGHTQRSMTNIQCELYFLEIPKMINLHGVSTEQNSYIWLCVIHIDLKTRTG